MLTQIYVAKWRPYELSRFREEWCQWTQIILIYMQSEGLLPAAFMMIDDHKLRVHNV